MKQICGFLIVLSFLLFFSCTKNKKTDSHGNGTPWGCYCSWQITSGWHDTSTAFFYPADTSKESATQACNVRDGQVKAMAGVSGGYCRLY